MAYSIVMPHYAYKRVFGPAYLFLTKSAAAIRIEIERRQGLS